MTGVVRDPSGSPIQDVAVELETADRGPHRAKTASDGSFLVDFIGADPHRISISFRKNGYQDVRRILGEDARPHNQRNARPRSRSVGSSQLPPRAQRSPDEGAAVSSLNEASISARVTTP